MELLSPAGGPEQLAAALRGGADAVYLSGPALGMRASATFSEEKLAEAVRHVHACHKKAYVTCNTLATNSEADGLPRYLHYLEEIGADAIIVADIGIFLLARRTVPRMEAHISTQAGITNYRTALELFQLGASRVVLARELSLSAIHTLRRNIPDELEIECFVHGAMCMSFSGRCLISSFLTGRDANRGDCAQPCRWKYALMEEKRPGQYFPIAENENGSYILNAQDLCTITHLDMLAAAGVNSFKIEGRAKSVYYTAAVTGAYRAAIDSLKNNDIARARDLLAQNAVITPDLPREWKPPAWAVAEMDKISHRPYSTGFYYGTPDQYHESGGYQRDWQLLGVVEGCADGMLLVSQRNKFLPGQQAEIMRPQLAPQPFMIEKIYDAQTHEELESAPHPMQRCLLPFAGEPPPEGSMLRRPE